MLPSSFRRTKQRFFSARSLLGHQRSPSIRSPAYDSSCSVDDHARVDPLGHDLDSADHCHHFRLGQTDEFQQTAAVRIIQQQILRDLLGMRLVLHTGADHDHRLRAGVSRDEKTLSRTRPRFVRSLCSFSCTLSSVKIAAAKLANATRTQKPITTKSNHHHHHHHRRREQSLGSSIINATNSSLKYSVSTGSVMENFSTDDAEEALYPKLECSTVMPHSGNSVAHTTNTNHCIQSQKSDMSTSQMSLSLSIDESKLLPISKYGNSLDRFPISMRRGGRQTAQSAD